MTEIKIHKVRSEQEIMTVFDLPEKYRTRPGDFDYLSEDEWHSERIVYLEDVDIAFDLGDMMATTSDWLPEGPWDAFESTTFFDGYAFRYDADNDMETVTVAHMMS